MINKCIFIGRLGREPDTKYLPSGEPVCNFSIAIDESYKTKSGEKVSKTEWVNIVTFRKLAEICGKYLVKGKLVYIEGKIQTRSWEDKEGVKRYTTEIVANDMKMLESRSKGAADAEEANNSHGGDVPF